jgi:hypothetical protein
MKEIAGEENNGYVVVKNVNTNQLGNRPTYYVFPNLLSTIKKLIIIDKSLINWPKNAKRSKG